jgi:hypothetical protein
MTFDRFSAAIGAFFLLSAGPALAGLSESGLWNVSDKTVSEVDPSSSMGQLMKQVGKTGVPDKTDSFQICLTPKTGDFLWTIPKKETPLESKMPGCTIKNRRQTGNFFAFDTECKSLQSHREANRTDKHHVVEFIKSNALAGITSTITRTGTWLKADCGTVEPVLK